GAATALAVDFLRGRAQARAPFFAWVHLFDPHQPYVLPPGTATTDDSDLARYRAEVIYTDLQIARLFRALETTGLLDRTIVVVTADHGDEFGDHGGQYHSTSLYDELIRVPLIVRVPGLPPRVVDEAVSLLDIAPTALDLLGVPAPATFEGRSLKPLLRGEPFAAKAVHAEIAYKDFHRQYARIE
ncbi:MAG: sulfatase, partial [Myxococcales bacterium]|nr:sulfatase [Myxococcales bacterium]